MAFISWAQAVDTVKLLPQGGPACCNVSVTNLCNATCDFCGYAKDKQNVTKDNRAFIDAKLAIKAFDILFKKGVRYLTFSGGEPLLHPQLFSMAQAATHKGMRVAIVTNGSTLIQRNIDRIITSGVRTVFISIDSPHAEAHEANRGLAGVFERIEVAVGKLRAADIRVIASVTINRLIDDFDALAKRLKELGFETVTFTYPKTTLSSTSLVYSEDSRLIDFTPDELIERLRQVRNMKDNQEGLGILNPKAALEEMIRHVRRERELFPCVGGSNYFFMDWNFNIFRCDYWFEPICKVWDFATALPIKDGCTQCMSVCYRDASALMGLPIAIGETIGHLQRGRFRDAGKALFGQTARASAKALWQEWRTINKLARTGRHRVQEVP
ncbi:MAG: radical SAM protein [Alphaproteobacteria bacterium]